MFFLLNKLFLPFRNPTNRLVGGCPHCSRWYACGGFALYPPTIHFVFVVRNMAALRASVQTWWCVLINDFLVNCMLYVVAAPLWDF